MWESVWQYPQIARAPTLDVDHVLYGSFFAFLVGWVLWSAFTLARHAGVFRRLALVAAQLLGIGLFTALVVGVPTE
jgi:hypothetical protein